MKSSTHTKFIVAGLALGALWLAAPAAGSVAEPPPANPDTTLAKSTGDEQNAGPLSKRVIEGDTEVGVNHDVAGDVP